MKKVLIRAYAERNLGDDMFITYLCGRYPSVCFYILCKDQFKTALERIPNLEISTNAENLLQIRFDLQIIIGGSIFMQSVSKSILEKYISDKEMLLQGIPTYIIGPNFGPYKSKIFFLLYKRLFKRVDDIVFRDEYSYNLFHLNNTGWAPDIVFNFPLPLCNSRKVVTISCIKKNRRSGLTDYDEDLYLHKLADIAEEYTKHGFSIVLAAFSKVQEDDIAAELIYNMLSTRAHSMTKVIVYQGDINAFLKEFLSTSYIIGTRFHSVILGWSAGIPTFPICYNDKLVHAIVSYGYKGSFAYINKMEEVIFSHVELNRKKDNDINNQTLKAQAIKHFLSLDKMLMEEHNE